MNIDLDFSLMECTDEKDFLKKVVNPYSYESTMINIIENLDPNDFKNDDEFNEKAMKISCFKMDYKKQFIGFESGAEYHWYFTQGYDAFCNGLIIPAILSFLCGIEASLRSTLYIINKQGDKIYVKEIMNMNSISEAYDKNLPVLDLAFSNETNFLNKIQSKEKINLIEIRNDLMHGNIGSYCKKFHDYRIVTPENLLEDAIEIIIISRKWAQSISDFKNKFFNKGA